MVLRIGQEDAGVKLLDVDTPWSALVLFNHREHTLVLFNRDKIESNFSPRPVADAPGLHPAFSTEPFGVNDDADEVGDQP